MQIFVKIFNGKILTIDVASTDTIERVKEIIEYKVGIPSNQYRLSFSCKLLDDKKTLSDYQI